jgi:uncharacterized protein YndB with AHSA1/START domain
MRIVAAALALGLSMPASAEIVDVQANGMEVRQQVHIEAPPDKVWAALMAPARWWSSDHSFSGSSANITIDPKVGGCWCETLPNGGGVRHMEVTYIAPPKTVVFRGALGPFYNLAADGALSYTLAEKDGGTDVTVVFRAGGYVKEGFQKWAGAVDGVFAQQTGNLKKHIEGAGGAGRGED